MILELPKQRLAAIEAAIQALPRDAKKKRRKKRGRQPQSDREMGGLSVEGKYKTQNLAPLNRVPEDETGLPAEAAP